MSEEKFIKEYMSFVNDVTSSFSKDDEVYLEKMNELKSKFNGNLSRMETSVAGIAGEAGEINDLWKKIKFHGLDWDDKQKDKMISEIGDMYWYLMQASMALGASPIEMMQKNLDKLKGRYANNKFDSKVTIDKEKRKEAS